MTKDNFRWRCEIPAPVPSLIEAALLKNEKELDEETAQFLRTIAAQLTKLERIVTSQTAGKQGERQEQSTRSSTSLMSSTRRCWSAVSRS